MGLYTYILTQILTNKYIFTIGIKLTGIFLMTFHIINYVKLMDFMTSINDQLFSIVFCCFSPFCEQFQWEIKYPNNAINCLKFGQVQSTIFIAHSKRLCMHTHAHIIIYPREIKITCSETDFGGSRNSQVLCVNIRMKRLKFIFSNSTVYMYL